MYFLLLLLFTAQSHWMKMVPLFHSSCWVEMLLANETVKSSQRFFFAHVDTAVWETFLTRAIKRKREKKSNKNIWVAKWLLEFCSFLGNWRQGATSLEIFLPFLKSKKHLFEFLQKNDFLINQILVYFIFIFSCDKIYRNFHKITFKIRVEFIHCLKTFNSGWQLKKHSDMSNYG